MTRLFVRFYCAVLLILFAAAIVQNYVTRQQNADNNIRVVENALAGGVRLARDSFAVFPRIDRNELLALIRGRFAYPVEILPMAKVPKTVADRFSKDRDVIYHSGPDGGMIKTPLPDGEFVLSFGPLPQFAEPSQTEELAGLGLVLAIAAIAIGVLLRPVARQFRLIESTAMRVADGDFSARVDESRTASTRPIAAAFNHMAGRTEALLRTQQELLQAVSHELRTPLSRIEFAIDLVRTSKTDADREKRLKSIEVATEDLDKLVGELLRYVRMETSEPELQRSDILLLPVIQALIEKTSLLYPHVRFVLGDELSVGSTVINADRIGLERAVGNLVENAARFAKSEVRVEVSSDSAATVISVVDDGPGVPEGDRDRIFDPFVRLDDSNSGVGLGLALVRRILQHHGGVVTVESGETGGCQLFTTWPHDDAAHGV